MPMKKVQRMAKQINQLKGALRIEVDLREQRLEQHGERYNELFGSLHQLYLDIKTHFEKKAANRAIRLNRMVKEAKEALESCK